MKSFLGLVTFVDKFVPHRATRTEKLRALANAENFYWSEAEDVEFQAFKQEALKTIKTLGYFKTSDRTEIFVDASAVGLGAVLIQFNDKGVPRIIACASKALTTTEQRYPQTHREALAVVWGVERFAYYLSGRTFVIRTDAEANQFIFGGKHRIGKRAVSRAEAWALRLQPFDFTIERVPGEVGFMFSYQLELTIILLIQVNKMWQTFYQDYFGVLMSRYRSKITAKTMHSSRWIRVAWIFALETLKRQPTRMRS